MKTKFHYVILRDIPGFRSCYLNYDSDRACHIVSHCPRLFENEAIARLYGSDFTDMHGGKASVHEVEITRP